MITKCFPDMEDQIIILSSDVSITPAAIEEGKTQQGLKHVVDYARSYTTCVYAFAEFDGRLPLAGSLKSMSLI